MHLAKLWPNICSVNGVEPSYPPPFVGSVGHDPSPALTLDMVPGATRLLTKRMAREGMRFITTHSATTSKAVGSVRAFLVASGGTRREGGGC